MKTQDPEEIEKAIQALADDWNKETQFLIDRGWAKTDQVWKKDGFEAQVWQHPSSGKEYAHVSPLIGIWPRAFDCAITDYIEELGWESVVSRVEFRSKIARHNWGRYLHPASRKVYSWSEACMIVQEFDNDDARCPRERLSRITCRLHGLLEDYRLERDNFILLFLQLLPNDPAQPHDIRSCHHLIQVFSSEDAWKSWAAKNNLETAEQWKKWADDNEF